jgi:hypothetical protein
MILINQKIIPQKKIIPFNDSRAYIYGLKYLVNNDKQSY